MPSVFHSSAKHTHTHTCIFFFFLYRATGSRSRLSPSPLLCHFIPDQLAHHHFAGFLHTHTHTSATNAQRAQWTETGRKKIALSESERRTVPRTQRQLGDFAGVNNFNRFQQFSVLIRHFGRAALECSSDRGAQETSKQKN